MIQNPNVLVRNFFEKVVYSENSRTVSGSFEKTVDTSDYQYLLLSINVSSSNLGSYLKVTDAATSEVLPIYVVGTRDKTPYNTAQAAMTFSKDGSYLLYVYTASISSVKIRLRSNPAMTVDYAYGVANTLPDIVGNPVFVHINSVDLTESYITKILYPTKKYLEVAVNCIDNKNGSTNVSVLNNNVKLDINTIMSNQIITANTFNIINNGWHYYYVDVSEFDSVTLSLVNSLNSNQTLYVQSQFVDELGSNYVVSKTSTIDIPNSPICLEYIGDTTACYNEWRALVSANGHSLKIWNTRAKWEKEITDISSVLGEGVYVDTTELRQVRILPYDSSFTSNNNAQFNIVLRATDGYYYYCNLYQDLTVASNWKKVTFWEKKNTKRKIVTKSQSDVTGDSAHFRYDTTLPDWMYGHNSISSEGLIEYQDRPWLRSLGPIANNKKVVMIGQYGTEHDAEFYRINLWATTDGGANFVSIYDFSPYHWEHINNSLIPINTSGFASYNNDLSLYKVTRNYPSATTKEPEHPYSISNAITITTISAAAQCVVTAPSHGLSNGDVVVFGSNSNTDWKQLSSNGFSSDSIGDNAYFVEVIDTNSFYIRYFRGSYDTNLTCRHIHSVNATNYGFVVCTGEKYPDGWELYVEQNKRNETINIMSEVLNIYRLNSAQKSVQRLCGALLTSEVQPTLIAFSDEGAIFDNTDTFEIDGRNGAMPKNSSFGIWRGPLSKIDTFYNDYKRVAASPEPSIWAIQTGNLIVDYLQWGGLMVSVDGGYTFTYIANIGNGVVREPNVVNGIMQNSICISGGYLIKAKNK